MKYFIFFIMFCLLCSCDNKPFTGYVVGKEYIQGHMCHDENYDHVVEAAYIHVPHTHHHKWQDSEFILHVANHKELRHIHVDSITFENYKLLELVTFKTE